MDRRWYPNGEIKISVFLVLGIGVRMGAIATCRRTIFNCVGEKLSKLAGSDSITKGAVVRVAGCALDLAPEAWPFAARHKHEIAEHWEQCRSERPKLYDGVVHLLRNGTIEHNVFTATFLRTDFKSFLYWRALGYPDAGVRGGFDSFGSAVIRSAEGHVLLGRQAAGNLNEGLT